MLENLITVGMLTLLMMVLGFDNLLYISLESKRAPADKRVMVRRLGIGIAIGLRLVLLFVLVHLLETFKDPLFSIHLGSLVDGSFNLHGIVVVVGGTFILYTATKEILHMVAIEDLAHDEREPRSVGSIVLWIVLMNLIFSFDSILGAMALTDVFWVMAVAIVITGVAMIYLADHVAEFLEKNRMYEVLGLFVLFIVGIMLLSEGGHLAHLHVFGHEVIAMSKGTFYFVIGVLIATDIVQTRYQKKLIAMKHAEAHRRRSQDERHRQ